MFDAEKGVYFISTETDESTKGGKKNTKRAVSRPKPPICRSESWAEDIIESEVTQVKGKQVRWIIPCEGSLVQATLYTVSSHSQ